MLFFSDTFVNLLGQGHWNWLDGVSCCDLDTEHSYLVLSLDTVAYDDLHVSLDAQGSLVERLIFW